MALTCACRIGPPPPSTVTVLVESSPESLDRRFAQSTTAQRIAGLVTPGLMTFDDGARPVGDIAKAIEWPDLRTCALTLRDARFSTGEPVTAADVVATYRSLVDPAIASPLKSKFDIVDSMEARGERQVVFRLKEAYAPFLSDLVVGILPRRLADAGALSEMSRRPVGAGPFAVARWDEDEVVELVANPHYYGGRPAIDRVVVRTVRDETTRVLELMKGRADLAVGAVSPVVLPALLASGRVDVQRPGGTAYAYLVFNLRSGPTADVRVRRAVDCALDREAIVATKFRGAARPAAGMIPEGHWAFAPQRECRHDLARAGALLDEAGHLDPDGDGPRPRPLRLVYKTSTDRFRRSVALAIAEQLRRVGMEVEVRTLEFSTLFQQLQHGAFEMASLKWSAVVEPDLMRWVFGCGQVPTAANHFAGWNRGGYCNPGLDALLEKAAGLAGESERRVLYAGAQARLGEDLPYVPLWHEDNVTVVSRRLEGFRASPHGFLTGLAEARVTAGAGEGPRLP